MPWKKATFKDQRVWAQVDAAGSPALDGGRLPIRYSVSAGATVYLATPSRVAIAADAVSEELPFGTDAGKASEPKSTGNGKGRGSGFGKAGTRTQAQAQAAHADATARLGAVAPGTVVCFTDGACKGNPGPAGSGAVVVLADGRQAEACRALGRATNNVAELTAIALALDLLDAAEVSAAAPVVLYTDSAYARGVLVQGWKAKANTELITALRQRLSTRPRARIEWVAGHVGLKDNERADALANLGVGGTSRQTPFEVPVP